VASEVDIVNMGLGHLGDAANVSSIDPPDGSAQADHAVRFFSIARDQLLEEGTWSFATRRQALTQLSVNPLDGLWAYAYQLPDQCIKPVAVLMSMIADDTDPEASRPFIVETLDDGSGVIYTNAQSAVLKFIWRQEDTTRFSPKFCVAFSWLLAHYFAGPITKDANQAKAAYQIYEVVRDNALASDANAQRNHPLQKQTYVPAHLRART
jgi:hypothetical protein